MQAVLVFTEGLLIIQYLYQIPTRLHCGFMTPDLQKEAEIVGIHGSAYRGIPIFCVYLATLMHTYQLSQQLVSRFSFWAPQKISLVSLYRIRKRAKSTCR